MTYPPQNLRALMEHEMEFNVAFIEANGAETLAPRWVAQNDAGETFALMTPWSNEAEKAAVLSFLRHFFALHGVIRYTLSSEVWAREASTRCAFDDGIAPSEHPDRIERVLVLGVAHGIRITCHANIERFPRVRCGPVVWMTSPQGGRMLGLLPAAEDRPMTPDEEREIERIFARFGGLKR